jgi:PAS domain S-box-containing protein
MAFVRDLSEQEQVKKALRISEGNFKAVVNNANDGILIADRTGRHIYANPKAAEITGYTVPQLLESTMKELAHPDEFEEFMTKFQLTLAEEAPKEIHKARIISKNGEVIHVEITSALTVWNNEPSPIVIIRKTR